MECVSKSRAEKRKYIRCFTSMFLSLKVYSFPCIGLVPALLNVFLCTSCFFNAIVNYILYDVIFQLFIGHIQKYNWFFVLTLYLSFSLAKLTRSSSFITFSLGFSTYTIMICKWTWFYFFNLCDFFPTTLDMICMERGVVISSWFIFVNLDHSCWILSLNS